MNSTDETMGRNSGIFWAFLQCRLSKGRYFLFVGRRGVSGKGEGRGSVVVLDSEL